MLERLNLNVPRETRVALKRLARRAGRKEGELARELLVRAVADLEREAFFEALQQAMTPAARRRMGALACAMEKVRGGAR